MGELSLIRTPPLLASLLLAAAVGCGGGDDGGTPSGARGGPPRALETTRESSPPPRERVYEYDGRLASSEVVVAGLPMPRGFEIEQERPRVTVLRGRVPVNKVLEYFGPRLMTGRVERIGAGARYIDAVPVGVQGGVVHLDVSILPRSSGGTRVEVRERLPEGSEATPDPTRPPGSENF